MQIKNAPIDDVLLIRQQVMYPANDLDFVKLEEDDRGYHFGVYEKGKLISVISLFIDGNEMQFRKFATIEEMQGNGYGTELLKYVFYFAKEHQIKKVWCNARTSALGMYEKFGMEQGKEKWIKYGLEFVKMEKNI